MPYPTRPYPDKNSWALSPENSLPEKIKNSTMPYVFSSLRNLSKIIKDLNSIDDPTLGSVIQLLQKHEANLSRLHLTLDRIHSYCHKEKQKVNPKAKKKESD